MHVAVVVHRYGKNVEGGAETHARLLSEQLVKVLGWQVSVFTTTSKDSITWTPDMAPGVETTAEGISVHRFRVRQTKSPVLFALYHFLVAWFLKIRGAKPGGDRQSFLEKSWYRLMGPHCPDLVDSLKRSQDLFDGVVFFNSQHFSTVEGLSQVKGKKILIPGIYDEKAAYFRSTRRALDSASHIAVTSDEELSFLRRIYPVQAQKAKVLAIGIDASIYADSDEVVLSDLPETFVLYLGRISKAKQVDRLIRNFETFKRERVENDLHLVLAGQREPGIQIPDAPFFHYVGFVSDREKLHLIRRALCVLNSSPLENLSLITLEALALGIPILVNEVSETLRYYMKWAPTVFGYRNEASFIRQLNEVTSINWREDPIRRAQVEQSRLWVVDTFAWSKVTNQLENWLNH